MLAGQAELLRGLCARLKEADLSQRRAQQGAQSVQALLEAQLLGVQNRYAGGPTGRAVDRTLAQQLEAIKQEQQVVVESVQRGLQQQAQVLVRAEQERAGLLQAREAAAAEPLLAEQQRMMLGAEQRLTQLEAWECQRVALAASETESQLRKQLDDLTRERDAARADAGRSQQIEGVYLSRLLRDRERDATEAQKENAPRPAGEPELPRKDARQLDPGARPHPEARGLQPPPRGPAPQLPLQPEQRPLQQEARPLQPEARPLPSTVPVLRMVSPRGADGLRRSIDRSMGHDPRLSPRGVDARPWARYAMPVRGGVSRVRSQSPPRDAVLLDAIAGALDGRASTHALQARGAAFQQHHEARVERAGSAGPRWA